MSKCDTLADIGTDHGLLPAFLLQNGTVSHVICTDIHYAPLEKARALFRTSGFCLRADFRLGDGLDVIDPYEADTVVIAGMGGETIADILSRGSVPNDGRVFILQPMTKTERLRKYLAENGFAVEDWRLCRDKRKICECLRVVKVSPENGLAVESDPLYYFIGRRTPQTEALYPEYISQLIGKTEKNLKGLRSAKCEDAEAVAGLEALCEKLKALL